MPTSSGAIRPAAFEPTATDNHHAGAHRERASRHPGVSSPPVAMQAEPCTRPPRGDAAA